MTKANVKQLSDGQTVGPQFSEEDEFKIVESIVTRGDISGLNPQQRAQYYITYCRSLGLNPATKPLDIIKLQGKEILYPNRGSSDQLARKHNLNRRIVEGPDVRDFGGTKLAYAKCEASLPGGRTEVSVATLPVVDLPNLLMKVETKAKRRATLSILGLGMIDEMELETIPAHVKSAAEPIDLTAGQVVRSIAASPKAHELPATTETPGIVLSDLLKNYNEELQKVQIPAEAVSLWLKHRKSLSEVSATERDNAFRALCTHVEITSKIKNPKVMLRKLIADQITAADSEDDFPTWQAETAPVEAQQPKTDATPPAKPHPLSIDAVKEKLDAMGNRVSLAALVLLWINEKLSESGEFGQSAIRLFMARLPAESSSALFNESVAAYRILLTQDAPPDPTGDAYVPNDRAYFIWFQRDLFAADNLAKIAQVWKHHVRYATKNMRGFWWKCAVVELALREGIDAKAALAKLNEAIKERPDPNAPAKKTSKAPANTSAKSDKEVGTPGKTEHAPVATAEGWRAHLLTKTTPYSCATSWAKWRHRYQHIAAQCRAITIDRMEALGATEEVIIDGKMTLVPLPAQLDGIVTKYEQDKIEREYAHSLVRKAA